MDSAKWSRNLNFESGPEINRMRVMAKQKLEMRRNRQQQMMITATRPQSGRPVKSAFVRATDRLIDLNSDHSDQQPINSEIDLMRSPLQTTNLIDNRHATSSLDSFDLSDQFRTNSGQDSHHHLHPDSGDVVDAEDDPYKYVDVSPLMSSGRRNIRSAYFSSESKMLQSKSVNNLNDYNQDSKQSLLAKETSLSIARLDQLNLNPLMTILNNQELLQFATTTVPKNKIYQCTIIRDKKGIDRSFYPTYYMHLQAITQNDGEKTSSTNDHSSTLHDVDHLLEHQVIKANPMDARRATLPAGLSSGLNRQVFLLSGRRRKKSKTYLIACDPFDITRTNCIAKLKSNVIGTQFTTIRIVANQQRLDHATIVYETNVLGFKGPRKMTILLPKIEDPSHYRLMKTDAGQNLYEMWKQDRSSVIELKNKTPVWNEETQSYVLNFRGRVTQASVKNFQLISINPDEDLDPQQQQQSIAAINGSDQLSDPPPSYYQSNNNNNNNNVSMASIQAASVGSSSLVELASSSHLDRSVDLSRTIRSTQSALTSSTSSVHRNRSTTTTSTTTTTTSSPSLALDEDIAMQFGRISEKEFTCDVTWPLSLLQAFAIALSSFDSKLACE